MQIEKYTSCGHCEHNSFTYERLNMFEKAKPKQERAILKAKNVIVMCKKTYMPCFSMQEAQAVIFSRAVLIFEASWTWVEIKCLSYPGVEVQVTVLHTSEITRCLFQYY